MADTTGNSTQHERRIRVDKLTDWAARVLRRAGLRTAAAARVAAILVDTDAAGIPTHGVILLPRIVGALQRGELNPRPTLRVVSSRRAAVHLNGDNGPGQLVATIAMDHAVRRARHAGIGLVSVSQTNHFGAASVYVEQAATAGYWGIAVSNSSARVAPVGAREPLLGTSPLALAALGTAGERLVLDFSTAAIARGKVRQAAREGYPIPAGVAQDKDGRPTTDAAAAMAGLLLPLGGERGLALGLFVELLSILGGGRLSSQVPLADDRWGELQLGQTFIAIDPQAFGAADHLAHQVARLQRETRRLAGRAPGDRRHSARVRALADGILLSPSVHQQLVDLGEHLRIRMSQ